MLEEMIKAGFGTCAIVLALAGCSSSSSSRTSDSAGSAGTLDNAGGSNPGPGSGGVAGGNNGGSDVTQGGGGSDGGGTTGGSGSAGEAGTGGRCGDLTLCGETCVNTDNDALNCGVCNRDCLGSTCSAGQCQPESIHAETGLARFAIDSTHLFYFAPDPDDAKRRAVRRVPIAGGAAPQDLAVDQEPKLAEMLIDDSHLYWAGGSNSVNSYVRRVLKSGGTVQTLKTGTDAPGSFTANSSTLFFTASDPIANERTLHKLNKDGGDYTLLESALTATLRGIAASASFIYYGQIEAGEQGLRRRTVAKIGSPTTIVPTQTGIDEVIFDTNEVFWTASGVIRKASADGKNVVDIGTATGDIEALAVDATDVYWTELVSGQRDLMTASRSGGGQRTLLTGIGTHSLGIGKYQVISDGKYVYYLNASGDEVLRVAK